MDLSLPLDYSAIERILPHRYPFLLVDRITEFEPDKRIVGIKNVTLNERYLAHGPASAPVLPPTILTEAVAQVGAIMILAKPENREKLIFFMGIERVRYRRPVHPGDVVEIEADVRRLRSRMGVLRGVARVDGKVVVEGTMTFALGPRNEAQADACELDSGPTARPSHHPDLHSARRPHGPSRIWMEVPPGVQDRRREHQRADPALVDSRGLRHAARVALQRPGLRECRARIGDRRQHVECEDAFASGARSWRSCGRR